jgi:type IV secretion system protein VirD4
LFLLDEASALGSLPALEEMLIRGRSGGARSVLAYQSDSQITTAFKNKPSLIYDNCSTQIYLGAPSSYETAERLSKALGDWTQVLEGYSETESWQPTAVGGQSGEQRNRSCSLNFSETGRALRRPEELLQQSNDRVIVLQRGQCPILANRVKWYEDPEFNPAAPKRSNRAWPGWSDLITPIWRQPSRASVVVRLVAAAILAMILWAMSNQANR